MGWILRSGGKIENDNLNLKFEVSTRGVCAFDFCFGGGIRAADARTGIVASWPGNNG